jgi:NTE family protein
VVSWHYARHLFGRATLQDLPPEKDAPRFVFYAASLQTGAGVRMMRRYVADYKVGWRLPRPRIRLADAIAASSAFPPVFSPMIIPTDPDKWRKWKNAKPGSTLDDPCFRSRLVLTDGGVYDNLGLEAIWDTYDTVLVSDASAPLKADPTPSSLWAWLTARVLSVLSCQTRALRVRRLIADYQNKVRKGTYWGVATKIGDYGLPDAMAKDTDLTRSLREVRTRLNRFDAIEQGHLINWGYALADAAMRRYVLHGGNPGHWPDPGHPL